MEALLNMPVTMPCLASQQKPRVAAKAAKLGGLRRSSIKGSQIACRRPALAKQRLVTLVRAVAAVEEETKVDEKTAMQAINAVRFLSIDGVNKANSGHPGLPMGCAPMGYILYNEFMQHNPKHPKWFNRDRFVLSAGHGCMLQYSLMHLTGYEAVSLEDCKQFRQWESKTPGHPENFETEGIEVTTGMTVNCATIFREQPGSTSCIVVRNPVSRPAGPLGQGIANAVGLAAAEAHLAARFNKDGHTVVDHYTYCILGDGCNMEGISNEACSLAGHWGLGKLIALYDDNKISIDGHTEISFTEDVNARFEALGWHVQTVTDGNTDLDSIRKAIEEAKSVTDKPSMIKVSTLIGYGSPNKADTHGVHGSPLGAEETKLTREALKWPYGEFEIPEEVYDTFSAAGKKGKALEEEWNKTLEEYSSKYKEEGEEFKTLINGVLPDGWADELPTFTEKDKGIATRLHSQTMLNALAPILPGFWGGSADLAPSNMTLMKMYGDFQKGQYQEKNLRFGVREHGMGAICNGIALHNPGMIPYCATFFNFTDYMRGAIRMSALSRAGTIFVMTHDSIGLGEDGPTHQPVEHLASFRAMPNILMMRPGDGNETAGCYKVAVENNRGINQKGYGRPTILALSRQGVPNLPGTSKEGVAKGGYIVHGGDEKPDAIILATGTELGLAVDAAKELEKDGKKMRVVSLVSWELFEEQGKEYKDSVLPPDVKARVSVEAASTFGWLRYVGFEGISLGVDQFGQSAPAPTIYEKLGITVEGAVKAVKSLL